MKEHVEIMLPGLSDWKCDIFGLQGQIVVRPYKGKVPNWFWRWMQYIFFGNLWKRV